jgi:hypothetical protein
MTTRYVGPGGSDGASGLSWALRKETLNGVEDTPVVAGDNIYVGPGVYRETLTCDVSGSSGNEITYIGDPMGIYTDGVGGEVRLSGSDDDESRTRSWGINVTGKLYRTFIGLTVEMTTAAAVYSAQPQPIGWNLLVEDCVFRHCGSGVGISTNASYDHVVATIRRCFFRTDGYAVSVNCNGSIPDALIENCVFYGGAQHIVGWTTPSGTTIKNCTFMNGLGKSGSVATIWFSGSPAGAIVAYNNLYICANMESDIAGHIVEDYGYIVPGERESEALTNITKGANSVTRPPMLMPPLLHEGFYIHQDSLGFMPGSPISLYGCGQSPPSTDFYGLPRPSTDSKKTRGAIQYNVVERETVIVPQGTSESIKMPDAMVHQIFVPITGKKMTFSVSVYREANYAGTNPQMILKQPGQSDIIVTDTGSSETFNTLSHSYTPASFPTFVVMQLLNDNTAVSGDYATYFGGFRVK